MEMKGIILGAGIAGLSTAIALQQRNIPVRIFESANVLRPVGAGILVPPNAMAILKRYKLNEQVSQAGIAIESLMLVDAQGQPLTHSPARFPNTKTGYPTIAIHRAALQKILLSAIAPETLLTNKTCVNVCNQSDHVELHFADETTAIGHFLIAADGIHSNIRQQLFPNSLLRDAGQICWRGIADIKLPPQHQRQLTEAWGLGCRFGFVPISSSEVYWYATVDNRKFSNTGDNAPNKFLSNCYKNFLNPIPDIIERTNAQAIRCDQIYDVTPLSQWYYQSTVLMGDAAHASTPNLGQGGAQAIEDSWVLAEKIAQTENLGKAFLDFQTLRFDRVQKIVQLSRQIGTLSNLSNPTVCAIRNKFMRWTPTYLANKQARQLYQLPY